MHEFLREDEYADAACLPGTQSATFHDHTICRMYAKWFDVYDARARVALLRARLFCNVLLALNLIVLACNAYCCYLAWRG